MQKNIRIKEEPPQKCSNPKCKAYIYKEDIKGYIPIMGMIHGVVIKCHKCDNITYVNMPIFLTNEWLDSLETMSSISIKDYNEFNDILEYEPEKFLEYLKKDADFYNFD